MRGVVGHDRAFRLGVTLFQSADFILFHIDSTKNEVYHAGDLFNIGFRVENDHILCVFRHRDGKRPAPFHRVLIPLSGRTARGGKSFDMKPGMIVKQGQETLPHHTRCSDHSDIVLLH